MPRTPSNDVADALTDLSAKQRKESGRIFAQRPKKIADVLGQVVSRKGYARQQSSADLSQAWAQAAGPALAAQTRVGQIRRGELEVFVAHSTMLQEISFVKDDILARLQQLGPDQKIRKLRFRVGAIH